MAGPTAFPASAIVSGILSIDRLPPGLGVPFVSVLDHGAKGDGETDDTAAIQAAIDAAYGKMLLVPKGEYILSQNASTGYCLSIMDSVSILMEPGAVLKLATSVPNTVNAIQIGDGSTGVSGVSIEGGIIDGNAAANGGSYSIARAAIYVTGSVQRVSIRGLIIRNCLASGLVVDGESSEARAKYITVEDCTITEVAEGVRFQKCDEFHMRGGSITKMMSQDGFEPHGAVHGWSLRDCFISEPHPTNSAIEVFPQWGDIVNGTVQGCTISGDEMRISLQSGSEGNATKGLIVQGCYFRNSNIYAGVNGRYSDVKIIGNRFEGPCTKTATVSQPHCGIRASGSADSRMAILNNDISGFQSHGMSVSVSNAIIIGNRVYNNGTDTSLSSSNRYGIRVSGESPVIIGNHSYDDQSVPTQYAGLWYSGDYARVIANTFSGLLGISTAGVTPQYAVLQGNVGTEPDFVSTLVTIAAGSTSVTIDTVALGFSSNALLASRSIAYPQGNMSPATHHWFTRSGGIFRLNVNAAPTVNTQFLVVIFAGGLRITLP